MIVRVMFSEMKQQIPLEDGRVGKNHVEEEKVKLLIKGQDQDPL